MSKKKQKVGVINPDYKKISYGAEYLKPTFRTGGHKTDKDRPRDNNWRNWKDQ